MRILSIIIIMASLSLYVFAQESIDGFILVKAGTFVMGAAPDEPGRSDEEAQHQVEITKNFFISSHEVTQKEWESVMGNGVASQRNKEDSKWKLYGEGADFPMYYISWNDAVEFCNKLSSKNGLTPCYSGSGSGIKCNFEANGYRLPTEAEWEYASRGGHNGKGTMYSGSDQFDNVAWQKRNSGNTIHPVGQLSPNELGIYDMSGNVYEWCWDIYEPHKTSAVKNPAGAASGDKRIIKGGSWGLGGYNCRSAYRQPFDPVRRSHSIGMRIVKNQE